MDFEKVAFALANPSFLRRLIFSIRELPEHKAIGHGYGYSVDIDSLEGCIVIPGLIDNVNRAKTPEDAFKFMVGRINESASRELITIEKKVVV